MAQCVIYDLYSRQSPAPHGAQVHLLCTKHMCLLSVVLTYTSPTDRLINILYMADAEEGEGDLAVIAAFPEFSAFIPFLEVQ